MDPVAESFRRIVEEIYWQESLEEAERTLEERIRNMDRDLRELLLERRREYCGGPQVCPLSSKPGGLTIV